MQIKKGKIGLKVYVLHISHFLFKLKRKWRASAGKQLRAIHATPHPPTKPNETHPRHAQAQATTTRPTLTATPLAIGNNSPTPNRNRKDR